MVIATRLFGEINVDDEKMIQFPGGIIGFSDMQNFALIHDDNCRSLYRTQNVFDGFCEFLGIMPGFVLHTSGI